MEEKKYIELTEHRAMITLPEDSLEVEINCKIFHEGDIQEVSKTMNMQEIREAFRKADDGYIDEDDTFVITEKGRKWLEEFEKQ